MQLKEEVIVWILLTAVLKDLAFYRWTGGSEKSIVSEPLVVVKIALLQNHS